MKVMIRSIMLNKKQSVRIMLQESLTNEQNVKDKENFKVRYLKTTIGNKIALVFLYFVNIYLYFIE